MKTDDPFLSSQLITCIGNKRSLLPFINRTVEGIKKRLDRKKLKVLDGFSGSGAVSRLLKEHASELWANDLEDYCEILSRCYLTNRSGVDLKRIEETVRALNVRKLSPKKNPGFIEKNYAPKNDDNIRPGERVFYTNRNAKILDNLKSFIFAEVPAGERPFYLAPLLVQASIHTNTSGVFKGFHKKNGLGWFGGRGENALDRIKKEIFLEMPVLGKTECAVRVTKMDANTLARTARSKESFDLAYFDPPYNQHPYGSNYFMLNLLANEKKLPIQNGVSGIVRDWKRSSYNKAGKAREAMESLLTDTPAKFILVSYNDEGLIPAGDFRTILGKLGKYEMLEQDYNTYRGSRNLGGRSIKVRERLWVLEKK